MGAAAQLTTFTQTKEVLREYEVFRYSRVLTAFIAGTFGGICQSLLQTPFDLVCVRVNNQCISFRFLVLWIIVGIFTDVDPTGRGALYQGMIDCFYKIVKYEGVLGLYKGFLITHIKNGRHTTLYLMFWELLKAHQYDVRPIKDPTCSCYYDSKDI